MGAEASIEKFFSCRWLKLVEEGCLTVDVRFLGEMEAWMVEVVGGVAKCQICRKVVVRGVYCTCDPMVAWHKYCRPSRSRPMWRRSVRTATALSFWTGKRQAPSR